MQGGRNWAAGAETMKGKAGKPLHGPGSSAGLPGGDTPVSEWWMHRASAGRAATEPETVPFQVGSRERAKECLPPCLAGTVSERKFKTLSAQTSHKKMRMR